VRFLRILLGWYVFLLMHNLQKCDELFLVPVFPSRVKDVSGRARRAMLSIRPGTSAAGGKFFARGPDAPGRDQGEDAQGQGWVELPHGQDRQSDHAGQDEASCPFFDIQGSGQKQESADGQNYLCKWRHNTAILRVIYLSLSMKRLFSYFPLDGKGGWA
jgi:hypothetical protein